MSRLLVVMAMGVSLGAAAQPEAPDEQWSQPPANASAPAAVPGAPLAAEPKPVYAPTPGSPGQWPAVTTRRRIVEAPNRTSMFGANALGQLKRGQSLVLGFPLLSVKFNIGVLDRLNVGVGFDSFYGAMNEPTVQAKYEVGNGERWRFAVGLEAGVAFFNQRAALENKGPRWITGQRNFNVAPGVVVSYQGENPRGARFFLDARYLLAFDTEPFATDPLNGVPSSLVLGHNAVVRGGAEIPLSERTSFVFCLGFDVHGRAEDARAMPHISLGLVTGL